jgi:hypothetical protein
MSAAVCANCGRATTAPGLVTYCGEGCEAARLALEAPGGQPEAVWREAEAGANEGAVIDADDVEVLRRSIYLLGRLADEHVGRHLDATSTAVAGREQQAAQRLWWAMRVVRAEVGDGRGED